MTPATADQGQHHPLSDLEAKVPRVRGGLRVGSRTVERPVTRYTLADDVSIAYQVVGDGPIDLVFFPGWFSHMDLQWSTRAVATFLQRLASFSRLILFDKRGVGLSDPVSSAPTLDERMDDVRAVMDAAGSDQAAVFGLSEGGTMSAMFAAAHPDRVRALILYGTWAAGAAILLEEKLPGWQQATKVIRLMDDVIEHWGDGRMIKVMAPSLAAHPLALEAMGAFERASLNRKMAKDLFDAVIHADARAALPLIRAPTLVLHRHDEFIPVEQARYLAEHIEGARLIELDGADHFPWAGDSESVASSVEEFVTGARPLPRPDRVLATVLFTDIVNSTEHAERLGDGKWRQVLADHDALVRLELERYDGREVKHTGDGFLATFTGPARAVRCACAIRDGVAQLGLQIRAGLHVGECELVEHDVRGVAVHIGARVAQLASAGEVLASRTVRDLLYGDSTEFSERGQHTLKGLPNAWDLYAVDRAA
jgi:class 3 adenylate cyclase